MDFSSDNSAGAAPEVMAAIAATNTGTAVSYGDDNVTERVKGQFREIFERDLEVFLVGTGTAANALGLSAITPPYGAIYCHPDSHIYVDECCAPEFFSSGAKLFPMANRGDGKIGVAEFEAALEHFMPGFFHHPQPATLSISQLSELGTAYTPEETGALAELCKSHDLAFHLDGARFANAVASTGCHPADLTWRAGVDVMSFGGTKNGALMAEAVIFFDPPRAQEFRYLLKRGGQVFSKSRFLAAQMEAMLTDGLWLKLAGHANQMAQMMADGICKRDKEALVASVEGNEVFACLSNAVAAKLSAAGARYYPWPAGNKNGLNAYRFVTSFATQESEVGAFLDCLG